MSWILFLPKIKEMCYILSLRKPHYNLVWGADRNLSHLLIESLRSRKSFVWSNIKMSLMTEFSHLCDLYHSNFQNHVFLFLDTGHVARSASLPLKCPLGSKPCSDGKECVLYSHVCDGEKDCKDGSDERNCERKCKKGTLCGRVNFISNVKEN